jgi:uncharacterized protein
MRFTRTRRTIAMVTLAAALAGCAGHAGSDAAPPRSATQSPQTQPELNRGLIEAAREGDVATVRRLLTAGAQVNGDPIHDYAPYLGNPLGFAKTNETARVLLDAGADVDAKYDQYTPLLNAVWHRDGARVALLLERGADPNYARKGRAALDIAATSGDLEIVRLLQTAGAKGDPKRIYLTHQLLRAACKGFREGANGRFPAYPGVLRDADGAPSFADLVKQGADVNWADGEGFTPLMYAANLGLLDNVETLLSLGADPHLVAKDGSTALSMAGNREYPDSAAVAALLREHPAKPH